MTSVAEKTMDALGAAIEARSAEGIAALYDDGTVIWHASTNAEQNKAENVGLLEGVFAVCSTIRYRDIRRYPIEGGIVQQHVLCGTFDDGRPFPDLHACMVVKISDEGKILRLDEYFDSAAFAEMAEKLAALSAA